MATLFTSAYITLLHRNRATRSGVRNAGPTHSTEGVCGPSLNGVVNDHQIGFDSLAK
jgi:hypothetical protein